jgi:hypothetical protein
MLTIGTQKSDRITTITNTTWSEYISLDLPSKRVSFRNGVITMLWEDNRIRLFVYRSQGYLELTTSNVLNGSLSTETAESAPVRSLPSLNSPKGLAPGVTSDRITEIVNNCFGKSVLEVEKYFA